MNLHIVKLFSLVNYHSWIIREMRTTKLIIFDDRNYVERFTETPETT